MKPFIQGGHTLALRAVRTVLGTDAGLRLIVETIETVDWASATFVGKRHRCELRVEGAQAAVSAAVERLARELPEVDVATSGYFLADAALDGFALAFDGEDTVASLTVDALTIED